MIDEKTIAAYDRRVDDYADIFAHAPPHPTLVSFVAKVQPGGYILDLGCGPANASAFMRAGGFKVDPVDASAEMVKYANATFDIGARLAVFDDIRGENLYDGIWANFSLLHAPAEQFPRHLTNFHRALIPGGVFHIAMKLGEGAARDKFDRLYAFYSQTELETLLTAADFTIVETALGEDIGLAGNVDPWIALLCLG